MGIESFSTLMKTIGYTPQKVSGDYFANKRCAIDGAYFMYRAFAGCHRRKIETLSVPLLLKSEIDRASLVNDVFDAMLSTLTNLFVHQKCDFVFVLDSRTKNQAKTTAHEKRELQYRKNREEYDEYKEKVAANPFDKTLQTKFKTVAMRHFKPLSHDEVDDWISILRYVGFSVEFADDEAEKRCAELATHGFVDFVYTADSDTLVFGASIVVRPSFNDTGSFDVFELDAILRLLGCTQKQFVDLCILLGTDFNTKIPRIGPNRALKLMRSIEWTLDKLPSAYEKHRAGLNIETCRALFSCEGSCSIELNVGMCPPSDTLNAGYSHLINRLEWLRTLCA